MTETVSLAAVDKVEVTVVMDNSIDLLAVPTETTTSGRSVVAAGDAALLCIDQLARHHLHGLTDRAVPDRKTRVVGRG